MTEKQVQTELEKSNSIEPPMKSQAKRKRLPKSQRTHTRRLKQAARKALRH